MQLILVLTSIIGLMALLNGAVGLVFSFRYPLVVGPPGPLLSNQLVMVAGATLLAVSIGFLAVISQIKKSKAQTL